MGYLDPQEARKLTSRELAKILCGDLSGMIGALIQWNDRIDVRAALDFIHEHWEELVTPALNLGLTKE